MGATEKYPTTTGEGVPWVRHFLLPPARALLHSPRSRKLPRPFEPDFPAGQLAPGDQGCRGRVWLGDFNDFAQPTGADPWPWSNVNGARGETTVRYRLGPRTLRRLHFNAAHSPQLVRLRAFVGASGPSPARSKGRRHIFAAWSQIGRAVGGRATARVGAGQPVSQVEQSQLQIEFILWQGQQLVAFLGCHLFLKKACQVVVADVDGFNGALPHQGQGPLGNLSLAIEQR